MVVLVWKGGEEYGERNVKPIGHNRLYINSNKVFSVVLQNTPLVYLDVASHCYCQLHKSAAPHQIPDPLLSMQKCIDDIKTWMTVNKLKLNDKTEAMIVSTGQESRSLFLLPRLLWTEVVHLFLYLTLSRTLVLHFMVLNLPMKTIWYTQPILNSVALAPSVHRCHKNYSLL